MIVALPGLFSYLFFFWIFTSGIQHKQLIKHSLLEIESRYVFLYNQALPNFYTHERSWRRGHDGKIYVHGDVLLLFFLRFDPAFFPPFSLSLPYLLPFLAHFLCWAV